VLHELLDVCVLSYIDDILVYSPTKEQHVKDVTKVLQLLRKNKLYVKLKKCELFQKKVTFLGHTISAERLTVESDKVKAIVDCPTPKSVAHIQSFIGTCSYYRKFVKDFAKISSPVTELLKKNTEWKWEDEQQKAFEQLKKALSTAPVLMTPDYSKPFNISSDACVSGIGGVCWQHDSEGRERPVAYYSRQLTPCERRWSIYEQELLA